MLTIGAIVELASGFSMQPCVPDVSRSRMVHPTMVDKSAGLSVGTAMAAMAAAMISTSGGSLAQPFVAPAFAAAVSQQQDDKQVVAKKTVDMSKVNAIYKKAFEQSEKLVFSEFGWGDAEVLSLSEAIREAPQLKKLYLNGNSITDEGAEALATVLREGAAPKLRILNLSQKQAVSERTKNCLRGARDGLMVSFATLKQATDAPVYLAADEGRLKPQRVLERAENTLSGTGQQLVDGSDATCAELQKLIDVDRATLVLEKKKLTANIKKNPVQLKLVEDLEQLLERQVNNLQMLEVKKGCGDAV